MSQTSVIAASLVLGFIVFTVVKGQLPCWLSIMGFSTANQCPKLAGIGGGFFGLNLTGGGITFTPPSATIGVGPVTIGV